MIYQYSRVINRILKMVKYQNFVIAYLTNARLWIRCTRYKGHVSLQN